MIQLLDCSALVDTATASDAEVRLSNVQRRVAHVCAQIPRLGLVRGVSCVRPCPTLHYGVQLSTQARLALRTSYTAGVTRV